MPPQTILVVEDDPTIASLLVSVLQDDGYLVDSAANGAEALTKAEQQCPELILVDLMMPVMDGQQFILQFRQRWGHGVPIIVMSAVGNLKRYAEATQADDMLPKPFDLGRLYTLVKHHLDPTRGS